MKQTFTSASTSINKNRLPALYHKVDFLSLAPRFVVDYGCGKYDNAKTFVEEEYGIDWYGYDKYNRGEEENQVALIVPADCVICSNLLNVIDSDDEIHRIANNIHSYHCPYFISVYDGDRSGVGRQTGPDSYQRNEKINSYLLFFPDAVIKHGVLTNCPEAVI